MSSISPPWRSRQEKYGTDDTYILAAEWLAECATVADWGGAQGYLERFLPADHVYTVVDGTLQTRSCKTILADLADYRRESDGILLRHVVDNTRDWRSVLRNAIAAFRQRLVVVTFTPEADETVMLEKGRRNGYPYWNFNPQDLRDEMGAFLHHDTFLQTSHPERIYYLEKA